MLYILYSNDYEVYLGGNYRPEIEVLVSATENVLSLCDNIGIPITLFCDVACLWRYRELDYFEFPNAVEDQLRRAIRQGHDVQVHLHPHWLETEVEYDDNGVSRYSFDLRKFLLGNWNTGDGDAFYRFALDILNRARKYLEDLLRSEEPAYRCVAYRAGGYGIQPHTKEIFAALQEAGYLIDSSVVPGMVLSSNVNDIDFTGAPEQGNYYISPKHGLEKPDREGIFEIPVIASNSVRWLLVRQILRKVIRRLNKQARFRPVSPGYSVQAGGRLAKRLSSLNRVKSILRPVLHGWAMLELNDDVDSLVDLTRIYVDRYGLKDGDLYFSFSCHSKSINTVTLAVMKEYHRRLKQLYGTKMESITYQEVTRHLKTDATITSTNPRRV